MTQDLRQYRDDMELPMEDLACTLERLGFKQEQLQDPQLIEAACRKLRTLHEIAQTVLTPGILAAVMAE